ncbi:MAG: flippase-like domain-containing protein [Lachnospiraceae bacterium]|nr:flippase-like domain-containing protein [Lachnospiraceae bacterium]
MGNGNVFIQREVIFIQKKKGQLLRWIFVIALIAVIVYTFRDSAGPILRELLQTPAWVVAGISAAAVCYHLAEGWITRSFARVYQPDFTYAAGVESAFYCSFYRVATLGSGAGVAAVYYFNEKGIAPSKGTGMYMMEYVVHKLSLALFSILFFLLDFSFMRQHFSEYLVYLVGGYVLTLLVAAGLILSCCSKKLHKGVLWLAARFNRRGRLDEKIAKLQEQCQILEGATADFMKNKRLLIASVGKNLLKFACYYGIPYLILHRETELSLIHVWAVTSVAIMLAAVMPAPAGIGSSEFMFTAMYTVLTDTAEAGSAALLYRFATFVLPFLIGSVVVVAGRFKKRRIT